MVTISECCDRNNKLMTITESDSHKQIARHSLRAAATLLTLLWLAFICSESVCFHTIVLLNFEPCLETWAVIVETQSAAAWMLFSALDNGAYRCCDLGTPPWPLSFTASQICPSTCYTRTCTAWATDLLTADRVLGVSYKVPFRVLIWLNWKFIDYRNSTAIQERTA